MPHNLHIIFILFLVINRISDLIMLFRLPLSSSLSQSSSQSAAPSWIPGCQPKGLREGMTQQSKEKWYDTTKTSKIRGDN